MADAPQEFGGPWTEIKLDAISDYLTFFTTALKQKPSRERPFTLWYIDAFAGSGSRTASQRAGGILEGRPVETQKVEMDGSAKRALAISPSFKHFVFIEQDPARFAALDRLRLQNVGRDIRAISGDANDVLSDLFSQNSWVGQRGGRGLHRAVVFLDPFDMTVRWNTLELLARTGAVDVWYLFPLNAVVRQLANDFDAVDAGKQASLDEIFGTTNWRAELYAAQPQLLLFNDIGSSVRRTKSPRDIEVYAKGRLRTLFPYVSDALPLLTPRGAQLFSLFCASANPSRVAHALIAKGVAHVLKKYG